MAKVIKAISSLEWNKGMGEPPACPYPEAGVVDSNVISLVSDPTSARFDPRPFVEAAVKKLSVTLGNEDLLNAISLAWLPQKLTYDDGTTEIVWQLEPLDGRTRVAACRLLGKPVKYAILKDAYRMTDRRLTELATVANTARTNYSPSEIAAKGPKMVAAYLTDKSVPKSTRTTKAAYDHVARLLDISVSELTLIVENWQKLDSTVQEQVNTGDLSTTVIRDLASLSREQQRETVVIAAEIEDKKVAIQTEEGKGGKRSDGTASVDACRMAKHLVTGQAMPESLTNRNVALTKAAEEVAKERGKVVKARTGQISAEERNACLMALSSWRTGAGLGHKDADSVGLLVSVLEWLKSGELDSRLSGLAGGDIGRILNASRE